MVQCATFGVFLDQTLHLNKFSDPQITAKGEMRASVPFRALNTLWFNTGTLCNLACAHCYIESNPKNDRLAYLSVPDVVHYLDEIRELGWDTREIGFTGGEPLINPHIIPMLEVTLARGFDVIVLTNAFHVIGRHKQALLGLKDRYGDRLMLRVSLDHYSAELHDEERGPRAFEVTTRWLKWLSDEGFHIGVAGRQMWGESQERSRDGFKRLFDELGLRIDMASSRHFVLFPEMDGNMNVPEITVSCWSILNKNPDDVMCASSRMVVKRKDANEPVILACTLLAYDPQFEVGKSLSTMDRTVMLNHPHCAKFCVLGGASCSGN
ncbi:MAG: radical SAM protein [Acidobacteria bacterium]|nr:radical SAM protein [Acidobacteriota bacterium]